MVLLFCYFFAFVDEGIDNDSFDLLDEETLLKLFPKSGPRLLFKKHYSNYKKSKSSDSVNDNT